jgi:hypothetical protein
MPSGRQVFVFFCSAPDHRHTAQRFHTAWVKTRTALWRSHVRCPQLRTWLKGKRRASAPPESHKPNTPSHHHTTALLKGAPAHPLPCLDAAACGRGVTVAANHKTHSITKPPYPQFAEHSRATAGEEIALCWQDSGHSVCAPMHPPFYPEMQAHSSIRWFGGSVALQTSVLVIKCRAATTTGVRVKLL